MRAVPSRNARVESNLAGTQTRNSDPLCIVSANHLALIRSFLIDSGPPTPPRKLFCAIFFCIAVTPNLIGKFEN
jgi:hypothetical protein